MKKIFFLFIVSIWATSCQNRQNRELEAEQKFVDQFRNEKTKLETIISFVEQTYLTNPLYTKNNRLQFVALSKNYQKGYIYADSVITSKLKGSLVVDCTFEKNSHCNGNPVYDMVRFRIHSEGLEYDYFYVYEYCPREFSNKRTSHFKAIKLNNNWSLEAEK